MKINKYTSHIILNIGAVFVWLLLLGTFNRAGATDYFVDKNHPAASDANSGIEDRPFATIQRAVDLAQAGDTVLIKGSIDPNSPQAVYNVTRNGITAMAPGEAGRPITIQSYPGHTVIIEGTGGGNGIELDNGVISGPTMRSANYHIFRGLIFRNFNKATEGWAAKTDILIEKCEFTHTHETGLRLRNITNLVMRDCYVHHCFEAGIYLNEGVNATFERVISSYNDDLRGEDGDGDGFSTYGGENLTLIDCKAEGNSEDGFDLNTNAVITSIISTNNNVCGVKLWRRSGDNYAAKTMTIVNALIYGHGEAGIKISVGAAMNLYNSVVYGNGEEGVAFRNPNQDLPGLLIQGTINSHIVNSIISNNGTYGIAVSAVTGNVSNIVDAGHNLYFNNGNANAGLTSDTNSINGLDPLFYGPASGNFHLKDGSPAIDAGIILPEAGKDFDNNDRPFGAAVDIGAYEKIVIPGNQAPIFAVSSPTSFNVEENETLRVSFTAVDPEGNKLVFFIDSGDVVSQMNIEQDTGVFTFAPTFDQGGDNQNPTKVYNIKLGVTDETYPYPPNYLDITITVHNVNRPPVYGGLSRYTLIENQPFIFALDARDLDLGDNFTMELSGIPANARFNQEKGVIYWTPQSGQLGAHEVILTLDDGLESRQFSINLEVLSKIAYVEPTNPQDIFFVDELNGNDNNNGQEPNTAWKTIGKAARTLSAGQMVYIRAGTYHEGLTTSIMTRSGTVNAPIIFKAYPGEKVIMDGHDDSGVPISGCPRAFDLAGNVSNLVFDGIEFHHYYQPFCLRGNNNGLRILNCVNDNGLDGGYGVMGGGNDIRIENCVFNNIGDRTIYGNFNNLYIINTKIDTVPDRGISLSGADLDNLNIINCEISHAGRCGILVEGKSSLIMNTTVRDNSGAGILAYSQKSFIINTIISGTQIFGGDAFNIVTGANSDCEIINSVLALSARYGLYVRNETKECRIFNSIFYRNTSTEIVGLSGANVIEDYNIIYDPTEVIMPKGANTKLVDPGFVNAESGDFSLRDDSPAIDAGLDVSSFGFLTDIAGNSRPQGLGWDIGAYEYAQSSGAVLYGDVSGEGEISAYDAALTAQAAVGLITLTAEQTQKADVSGDAEISAYDAALIAQRAVGLIDRFPAEG